MELNRYPIQFGDRVRAIRNSMHLSQVKFYNYLFPNSGKTEENIKKIMNAIENGKTKSIDLTFCLTLCDKCEISADFLFALKNDYSNHEIEFVCKYTGLEEDAVKQLHNWNKAKNNGADLSKLGQAFWPSDEESAYRDVLAKQAGIQFLKIINLLFQKTPGRSKKKNSSSNLTILHSLYLLCMSQPVRIAGELYPNNQLHEMMIAEDPYLKSLLESVSLNAQKTLLLQDDSSCFYPISAKELLEQIAKNHLSNALDQLIEQVKQDNRQTKEDDDESSLFI